MGFFQALGRFLGGGGSRELADAERAELMRAWNLYETHPPSGPGTLAGETNPGSLDAGVAPVDYDRSQWHRRLKTTLERLPDSEDQWPDLMADVKALGFDPAWVEEAQRAEFVLLVRRAVADRTVTPQEHRKLEMARTLIGIPEDEAEAILHNIIREAESFFGGEVEGTH